jgi:hypothetical protein
LLGITGSRYTIFAMVKFSGLNNGGTNNDIEIFKVSANTPSNLNGIRLFIKGDNVEPRPSGTGAVVNMYVQLGSNEPYLCQTTSSSGIEIQYNKPYLFIISNNNSTIGMYMYTADSVNKTDILNMPLTGQNTVTAFSNEPLKINQNRNLNGNIYAFGIYSLVVNDISMGNLRTHLFNLIRSSDVAITTLTEQIDTLNSTVQQMRSCPMDAATCEACKSVTDWTNINNLLTTTDTNCHAAISAFCKANPSHGFCTCWNSNSSSYSSGHCKGFRGIFEGQTCSDIRELSKSDILAVKARYTLCDCGTEGGTSLKLTPTQLTPLTVPDISSDSCPSDTTTTVSSGGGSGSSSQQGQPETKKKMQVTHSDSMNDIYNPYTLMKVAAAAAAAATAAPKSRMVPDYFSDLGM